MSNEGAEKNNLLSQWITLPKRLRELGYEKGKVTVTCNDRLWIYVPEMEKGITITRNELKEDSDENK
jgi:hypothetical protein